MTALGLGRAALRKTLNAATLHIGTGLMAQHWRMEICQRSQSTHQLLAIRSTACTGGRMMGRRWPCRGAMRITTTPYAKCLHWQRNGVDKYLVQLQRLVPRLLQGTLAGADLVRACSLPIVVRRAMFSAQQHSSARQTGRAKWSTGTRVQLFKAFQQSFREAIPGPQSDPIIWMVMVCTIHPTCC